MPFLPPPPPNLDGLCPALSAALKAWGEVSLAGYAQGSMAIPVHLDVAYVQEPLTVPLSPPSAAEFKAGGMLVEATVIRTDVGSTLFEWKHPVVGASADETAAQVVLAIAALVKYRTPLGQWWQMMQRGVGTLTPEPPCGAGACHAGYADCPFHDYESGRCTKDDEGPTPEFGEIYEQAPPRRRRPRSPPSSEVEHTKAAEAIAKITAAKGSAMQEGLQKLGAEFLKMNEAQQKVWAKWAAKWAAQMDAATKKTARKSSVIPSALSAPTGSSCVIRSTSVTVSSP